MGDIAGIITAWLLATVKFALVYPSTVLTFNLNFFEALVFGVSAGVAGSYAFIYAGDFLIKKMNGLFPKREKKKKRKIFTKRNRRLIRIKNKYGLIGIAALSPVLISIPIGCLIAVRFYHNKKKILLHMAVAVTAWSLIMYPFASLIRSFFE